MVPKEWINVSLGDVITYKKGFAFDSSNFQSHGVQIIRISDTTSNSISLKNPIYVSKEVAAKLTAFIVHEGDIVLSTVGSRPHLVDSMVGKAVRIPKETEGSLLNQNLVKLIPKRSVIINDYLYLMVKKSRFIYFISTLIRGNANQVSITLKELFKYKFPLPPLIEQKKITQILSTWDKAITTTEKLLVNSEQQKKALVQQLLTGKKRFSKLSTSFNYTKTRYGTIPADWEHPAIRDICSQISEKNSTKANYPVLSCSKYDGFVDSLKYFKKKVYSDDTSAYRLIPRGCFGFPSNHIEEGSIGLQNSHDFGIVSPIYVVFRANPNRVNNQYLFALLKTEHYRQIFSAATNASVDRRGSLRWDEFSSIHVPLPTIEEQNEIASTLSLVDQEIKMLKQTLDHLKQEKNALMQQLLTGKKRVKVAEINNA